MADRPPFIRFGHSFAMTVGLAARPVVDAASIEIPPTAVEATVDAEDSAFVYGNRQPKI